MKIWLVQIGEPLPTDGDERLLRTGLMARVFASQGHEVVWWASTFDHVRKQQRNSESSSVQIMPNLELRMLSCVAYRSNISLRRLINHVHVAWRLRREMARRDVPDVIVSSFPTLETSWVAQTYARKHRVPVVVDIRDLWPDVLVEMAPDSMRKLVAAAFWPYAFFAAAILRRATALTGLSPPFLKWGEARCGRTLGEWDRVFPMAYSHRTPVAARVAELNEFWQSQGIEVDAVSLTCCFFGALGHQFDIETVIEAARRLEQRGERCRFIICGVGERAEDLKESARDLSSVIFTGWIGVDEIWTLMRRAHIGLAPYRASEHFAMNFPNKPAEYLSAGLPIVSSAGGYLAQKLADHDCGVSYNPGDVEALTEILISLSRDRSRLKRLADNARALYEAEFIAERVYAFYGQYLERLVAHTRTAFQ